MMKHFGHKGLVLGAVFCALAWAGNASAAGYEVRMPVEKTVRLAPLPDTPPAPPAKEGRKIVPATAAVPAAPSVSDAAPEAETPAPQKAESPKAAAKPAAKAKPVAEPAKSEAPKTEAAKPKAKTKPEAKAEAEAKAEPRSEPKPKPAPKPKPVQRIDPLALQAPPAPAAHEPIALPATGSYVGDVEVEFAEDHVVLRAATSAQVERVTYFSLNEPSGTRKLALDLRGPWRKKGPFVLRFDTGPLKNVVVGEHPDRLRLSLEFREGAVEQDLKPVIDTGDKGVAATIPLALRLRR